MNKTMKTKKRAIVAQPMPRFDVSKAKDYGPVLFLFEDPGALNPMSGQSAMDNIVRRLGEIGFDHKEDAIVLTGQVAIVALLLLAAWNGVDPVRCLMFDARDGGSYRMRLIDPRVEPIQ